MRSTVCLTLTVAALALTFAAPADTLVPRRTQSTITAPTVAAPPVIDGKLDDPAWQRAQPLRDWAYKGKGVRFPTDAWICRDAENIYVGARCFDDNLEALVTENEGTLLWKNDCLELFVVPEQSESFWTKLTAVCDGRFDGNVWVADEWGEPVSGDALELGVRTGREEDAWTVEIAIPIKPFGRALADGKPWAFGINREKWSPPQEVSSFQGGFNRPREYPPLHFAARDVVFDGVGVKNLSDRSQRVSLVLKSGETTTPVDLPLKPGESRPVDWDAALPGLAEGAEFTLELKNGGGSIAETYVLVPAAKPLVKLDPANLPPPKFRESPLDDPSFFPVSVWLQPAGKSVVEAYKDIGVNLYFGGISSYPRPKDRDWLDAVHAAGMYAIIGYNQRYVDNELYKHPAVIGWHHPDEPDLHQSGGGGAMPQGVLMADFLQMRAVEPNLPVFLNLGAGVGDDRFVGRATPYSEYPAYCDTADAIQFDIYPCNSLGATGPDRLHVVAKGMDRLKKWSGGTKRLGFAVECNKFTRANVKSSRSPTPDEVKTQMWMAIVHGARGLTLFCHSWAGPKMKVNGIAPDMMQALKGILGEIHELAAVINSPDIEDGATVKTSLGSRVDTLVKRHGGATYVLAVNMFRKPEEVQITVKSVKNGEAEVLFEDRTVPVKNGVIADAFEPYAVHRYRMK